MTRDEYKRIRDDLDVRYRDGMAALEQLWVALTGSNPPDSPLTLVGVEKIEPLRNAADMGIQRSEPHVEQTKRPYTTTPEMAAKKKAYMKAYWLKKKKAAA